MQQNNSLENKAGHLEDKVLSSLDKIKAHLLHDEQLDRSQAVMLVRFRKAFTYMAENQSPANAVKLIISEYKLSYAQACKTVRDAIKLFGDVNNYSRMGLKQVMFERFMNASNRAEEAGDFKAAEKMMHRACMVMDLYNPNNTDRDVKNVFNIVINRSTNADVLKKKENTIDITPEDG